MINNPFNIFMIGVGGQGIGLLSETLLRAADYAGYEVAGVDTHGLAQRGGTVTSHLRLGSNAKSPLIQPGFADLVISLERHEAIRGLVDFAKDESMLVYYDAVWQPLNVRLQKCAMMKEEDLLNSAGVKNVTLHKVFIENLEDSKMQNIALLAYICKNKIIENITEDNYINALNDMLPEHIAEKNLKLFNSLI